MCIRFCLPKPKTRGVRGRDRMHGNQDGEGLGTVIQVLPFGAPYNVGVQWDNGYFHRYRMSNGFYDLKLVPTVRY